MELLRTETVTGEHRDLDKIEKLAMEAFPPEEYMSPEYMLELSEYDNFHFDALYDADRFVGFMTTVDYKDLAYLFFLAIDPECRGMGLGSRAIQTMKNMYADKYLTVDFEVLDENAPNNEQRKRRKEFYLRNGFKETGHGLSYFGVDYEIMSTGKFELQTFRDMLMERRPGRKGPEFFTI